MYSIYHVSIVYEKEKLGDICSANIVKKMLATSFFVSSYLKAKTIIEFGKQTKFFQSSL